MNLLAIDTATEACSLALSVRGAVIERHEHAGRGHTQRIQPMLQALLAEAGLGISQLDGYVCGVGPGSFAGVRIGVGFIKGLALAHERPVVATSSLATLAQRAFAQGADGVIAAIDARLDELYLAAYRKAADACWRVVLAPCVTAPAKAPPLQAGSWVAVGSGWGAAAGALAAALGVTPQRVAADALPHAADALALAAPEFAAGRVLSAAELLPSYLRNKVALTLVEQQALRDARR